MWDGTVGNENVKKILTNALTYDKVAHAYLLAGPRNLGKSSVAITFAQTYFCTNLEFKPCQNCSNCKRILEGNYPDLKVVEPQGSSIKIEQIRDIQKLIQYKPYEGLGRVYIIKKAELMTVEAANCLLKVLEEPMINTVFLLLAENPYTLLPTILSRCQKLSFQPVPPQRLSDWLLLKGADKGQARVIASLSNGAPVKALEILTSEGKDKRIEVAHKAERVQQGDPITVLKIAEEMEKDKLNMLEELDLWAIWYRDMLVWSGTKESKLIMNLDLINDIKKQSANLGSTKLKEDLAELLKVKKNNRSNINLRLSLETLLLKLMNSA